MITNRRGNSPRNMAEVWLRELLQVANAEGARHTAARVISLSEPLIMMAASSGPADPDEFSQILSSGEYPERAERWMLRNATLLTGIETASRLDPVEVASRSRVASRILTNLPALAGTVFDASGAALSDMAEKVSEGLKMDKDEPDQEIWAGDGVAVLIREVSGLPGDADICAEVRDPRVLANALEALSQLGVTVDPEARASVAPDDGSASPSL